jgi:hypothetical protein
MKPTREGLTAVVRRTAARAERMVGKQTARELAEAGDEALIRLGHDAERRQRRRAVRRSLKQVAKTAVMVGASAAVVLAARNATRGRR